jgi:tRNA pseudouridine55 synthase
LGVSKIGHTGTLDPLATGVMVMLIGKKYTRLSDQLLGQEKEYLAEICLGVSTDTYDSEGLAVDKSSYVPNEQQIAQTLQLFQGEVEQIPPMFSAKKVNGKKLYELARKGKTIERRPSKVHLKTQLIAYSYPYLTLNIICSKGTYIRSIAQDLGVLLGCGAHLSNLRRLRSGDFFLKDCMDGDTLFSQDIDRSLVENRITT